MKVFRRVDRHERCHETCRERCRETCHERYIMDYIQIHWRLSFFVAIDLFDGQIEKKCATNTRRNTFMVK